MKDDCFDLNEVLSSLSRKQLDELWNNLQHKCTSALLHFDEDDMQDLDCLSSTVCINFELKTSDEY
jgi:hypothetical protein